MSPTGSAGGLGGEQDAAKPNPFVAMGAGAPTVEYCCTGCEYRISVSTELPACPMCGSTTWDNTSSRATAKNESDVI
jgi:hypothetical protein